MSIANRVDCALCMSSPCKCTEEQIAERFIAEQDRRAEEEFYEQLALEESAKDDWVDDIDEWVAK